MTTFATAVAGYDVVVDERFDSATLDRTRWLPYYLPQWAGRERSRARYRLTGEHLELFIAGDQPVWCPDIEPQLRVSSLQTGCFAGPVGSTVGQHRTDDRMAVVEAQPTERLITPTYGAVELRARWSPQPGQMVALWMIGFEERPEQSAEICICEIFGSDATAESARVGVGLHPFGDPDISDDFEQLETTIDVSTSHDYAVIWTPDDVTWYLDGEPVKHAGQSPRYPMQLMLDIYDFGNDGADRGGSDSPFVVDRIRVLAAR